MKIESLHWVCDGRPILNGITLDSRAHRIGVIGPNGAGKTSFLRLLCGLAKPSKGRIEIDAPAGLLFQSVEQQILFPTVIEELCFARIDSGEPASEVHARAQDLLKSLQSEWLWGRATHGLSLGEKQWLGILALLMQEPTTLLLDEPFSSLDILRSRALTKALWSLPQRLVIASHNLEALGVCDEMIWLHAGALQMQGPATEVIKAYRDWAYRDWADTQGPRGSTIQTSSQC